MTFDMAKSFAGNVQNSRLLVEEPEVAGIGWWRMCSRAGRIVVHVVEGWRFDLGLGMIGFAI